MACAIAHGGVKQGKVSGASLYHLEAYYTAVSLLLYANLSLKK